MNRRTEQGISRSAASAGLALGLGLPPTGPRRARDALLGSLPFLALARRAAGPVTGTLLDGGAEAMAWSGPGMLLRIDGPPQDASPQDASPQDASPQDGPVPSAVAAPQPTAPAVSPELRLKPAAPGRSGGAAGGQGGAPALFGLLGGARPVPQAVAAGPRDAKAGLGARAATGPQTRSADQPRLSSAPPAPETFKGERLPARPAQIVPSPAPVSIVGRIAAALEASQARAPERGAAEHPRRDKRREAPRSLPADGATQGREASRPLPADGATQRRGSRPAEAVQRARPAVPFASPGSPLLALLPALALRREGAAPDAGPVLPQRKVVEAAGAGSASPRRGGGSETPVVDRPPAIPDPPGLPQHRLPPGQAGVAMVRAFDAAVGSLEGLVQRKVERALERPTPDEGPAGGKGSRTGIDGGLEAPSDRTVRALMRKMRELEREDRFRSGRLA